MLVLLFYSIVCDAITYEDENILTQKDVKEVMNKNIPKVFLKNITISIPFSVNSIGIKAFQSFSYQIKFN